MFKFLVSQDTHIPFWDSLEMIGIILFSSSWGSMVMAPGLVDSPPTSIISAPFSCNFFP